MVDIQQSDELTQWFSTYGFITAERILGTYQINLPQDELLQAIKNPNSFYHLLLQVPLKNVLNGIIIQQAYDYHVYVQKLFIDYLLSGETTKGEEAQGALTRESLENERQKLVTLGEDFHKLELEQSNLIATSQAFLIKQTKEWKIALETAIKEINNTFKVANPDSQKGLIRKGLNHALINSDVIKIQSFDSKRLFIEKMNEIIKISLTEAIKEQVLNILTDLFNIMFEFNDKYNEYFENTKEIGVQAHSYRTEFYDTILRILELIKLLPEYRIDPVQDAINRETLYFDKTIGE